ncbi:hypothetical protein GEV33_008660 [Tenebrio molitor]|uniref:Uncharacterized protein n=1 Tax=Tenebrio molitor TaxID=7067 RepID=A0A8J6LHW1_TENMO|nr:hypothetical protein GEV33_008660 [Tenebrio molitor]
MSTQKVNILQNKVIKPMEDEETNFSLPSLIDSESLLQEIGFMEQVDDNEEAEAFTTQPPTRGKGKGKGKGCGDVEGPKRVRLEEESKPRRRGADLGIPDGRFVKNQTPECGVKFHAWISSFTVGPRKSRSPETSTAS